jgi:hypothetical protein
MSLANVETANNNTQQRRAIFIATEMMLVSGRGPRARVSNVRRARAGGASPQQKWDQDTMVWCPQLL